MISDARELNDAELNEVSSGMTCQQAKAAAKAYEIMGDILASWGYTNRASGMYGRAIGVIQGACT